MRDLFNILLPPTAQQTISQSLAESEERPLEEAKLWHKVAVVCRSASIPLDAMAPDFIVVPMAPPPIGVFRLAQSHEPEGHNDIFGDDRLVSPDDDDEPRKATVRSKRRRSPPLQSDGDL